MKMEQDLKKTTLYSEHEKLGGKIVPFAGWAMPVQYTSVKEESLSVRKKCGIFDVSHMGEFFVTGPDAIDFVDFLLTNDFKNVALNKAVYSPLCRENGTIIDDLIAYKLAPEEVLICVNAANIEKDWDWIFSQKGEYNCELKNLSSEFSLLAVQGPKSEEFLKDIGLDQLSQFEYYSAQRVESDKYQLICARTGYTGEDGFELFVKNEQVVSLWNDLVGKGVTPCGLAARDVLRLEVCYPLYGHELDDNVTPLDAGLKWTVKMDKPNFLGKQTLQSIDPQFKLLKIFLEKGIPREGYKVIGENGEEWGFVTSGTLSVTSGKGVALIRVKKSMPKEEKLFVEIRGKQYPATRTTKPFVTGGHK